MVLNPRSQKESTRNQFLKHWRTNTDQESAEEEEEEEEEPLGATTRSTTKSEAQRSKAQLAPSVKHKREVSPPGARTRGWQKVDGKPSGKAEVVILALAF